MRELAERITSGRKAIALAKQRGLDTSEWERRLIELFAEAGREPTIDEGMEPWMLWEWRRVSIPDWRRILKESTEKGDTRIREGTVRPGRPTSRTGRQIQDRRSRLIHAGFGGSGERGAVTPRAELNGRTAWDGTGRADRCRRSASGLTYERGVSFG